MWPSSSLARWRRLVRLLRTLLLFSLLLLGWSQILLPSFRMSSDDSQVVAADALQPRGRDHSEKSYEDFLNRVAAVDDDLRTLMNNGSTAATPNATRPAAAPKDDVRWQVHQVNLKQIVLNEDKFGAVTSNTVVFVIQVHTRLHYLRYLVDSFRQVRGIEETLLLFSHDYFDPELNRLIQGIDFARVMQVFYPFSTQLYADVFPGQDPNDCPWDVKKETALRLGCNNAEHPDLYGHYREAKYTQIKHHWWWKINRVFDGLHVTKNSTALFVFLEEDHYVVPDILYMLEMLEKAESQRCSQCNIISLGTYVKSVNFASDSGRLEVSPWIASKHNMGMVLRRENWQQMKACSQQFCSFDDYNWDWSLQHLSSTCLKSKLVVIMPKAPRVFHIGECGVHHKEKNCSSDKVLTKVQNLVSSVKDSLFPSRLSVVRTSRRVMKTPKGNGGWGDLRDQLLCLHHLNASSSSV